MLTSNVGNLIGVPALFEGHIGGETGDWFMFTSVIDIESANKSSNQAIDGMLNFRKFENF